MAIFSMPLAFFRSSKKRAHDLFGHRPFEPFRAALGDLGLADPLENRLFRFFTEAGELANLPSGGGLLQVLERGDFELLVEERDFLRPEAPHPHQSAQACGQLLLHLLEDRQLLRGDDRPDLVREVFADAGDAFQALLLGGEIGDAPGQAGDRPGGVPVGPDTERVLALDLE